MINATSKVVQHNIRDFPVLILFFLQLLDGTSASESQELASEESQQILVNTIIDNLFSFLLSTEIYTVFLGVEKKTRTRA